MAVNLPEAFINRMQLQLGDEAEDFIAAFNAPAPVSIRQNPFKRSGLDHLSLSGNILWEELGWYLYERPRFAHDPLFHAGAYYVQEASSMFLGHILRQLKGLDDCGLAIDLCAAPGGKSTQLLSYLQEKTILLANEVVSARIGALRQNLIRWGRPNALTTSMESAALAATGIRAGLVLVDAPCSGEGLFRKDPESVSHWSAENIIACAGRQQYILESAQRMVQEGGYLIYSTCTYNEQENINNALLINKEIYEPVQIDFPAEWNIKTIERDGVSGYQFYPHHVKGEGFFITVFRRSAINSAQRNKRQKQDWDFVQEKNIPAIFKPPAEGHFSIIQQNNTLYAMPLQIMDFPELKFKPLFELGQLLRNEFIPAHGLAMLAGTGAILPAISLDLKNALNYLRRIPFDYPDRLEKGFYFITYQGLRLGLAKVIPGRVNNYYPNEWRILK